MDPLSFGAYALEGPGTEPLPLVTIDGVTLMNRTRILTMSVLTVIALSALSGRATAASFRIEPGGAIRALSQGKVTFRSSLVNPECNLVMTGELSSALLEKRVGQEFGRITRVEASECVNLDRVPEILRLPWSLRYSAIVGTLPNEVTSVLFTAATPGFLLEIAGVRCLYTGSVGGTITVVARGGGHYDVERIQIALEETPLSRDGLNNGVFCPRMGRLAGNFNIEPRQNLFRL